MSVLPKLLCPSSRSNSLRRVLVSIAAFAVVSAASGAIAAPVTQTVPGTIVLVQSFRHTPDDRQCASHVFAQWADVPGTTYATAYYKVNGEDATKSVYAPLYSNAGREESLTAAGYTDAPAGFDRVLIASNGAAGGSLNREVFQADCNQMGAILFAAINSPTTVDLLIEQTIPTPTPTSIPTSIPDPSEQLISSVNTAISYAKAIKVAVPKKNLVIQKAIRKSLSDSGSAIVKFVKANKSTIILKPNKRKLPELAENVKKAIKQALKLNTSTFAKDKAAVVSALNAIKKAIAS